MRPFLLVLLFASLSLACDSAGDGPIPTEPGTFEATVTGDVTTELSGTAIVTVDAFGGEAELFLKLQAFPQGTILLWKSSLEPLSERTYPVGLGEDDPEAFSGTVAVIAEGPRGLFVADSGTVAVEEVSEHAAEGTFALVASSPLGGEGGVQVEGSFRALVP